MTVGPGEMPFKDAVRSFVFDHQGKMRRMMLCVLRCGVKRADENGERVGTHDLDEDGTIGELVESGRVHLEFSEQVRL